MEWEKPSGEVVETFNRIVPDSPIVEKRKMFGYPCRFVNGNMFMGVHQQNIFIRLPEQDRAEFLKLNEARLFEPMPGRPMKEYVVVPIWLLEEPIELEEWIEKSLAYVSEMPPKSKKTKK